MRDEGNISLKMGRVLNLFLLALILILVRVWFLAIIQHEDQLLLSQNPRRKSSIEKVDRGTIRDRYNIPLAENKATYSVAICYADLRDIPSFQWELNPLGKKIRTPKRREYIEKLCHVLSQELGMEASAIEDIIYGKAALFPQMPFVLKEALSEKEYFRLKLLEKQWLGLRTQKGSKRAYPLGKTGCDVLGYMGSISESEYKALSSKITELEHYVVEREQGELPLLPKGFENPLEVRSHLKYLKERAYTLQDFVGKSGIEARCDKELRGVYGKKYYEIDTKGNILRGLPGSKEPSFARRVVLTISSELQEYAEKLLSERENDGTSSIKGGAIVAMDPHTGEILALASYPRFSPQDFTPSYNSAEKAAKNRNISRWLETEEYLGQIWDGERPLEKEVFSDQKQFHEITEWLSLEVFLKKTFSEKSALFQKMKKIGTIQEMWAVQDAFGKLHELLGFCEPKQLLTELHSPPLEAGEEFLALKKELDKHLLAIPNDHDRLLFLDLCRLLVPKVAFSEDALGSLGSISPSDYHLDRQAVVSFSKALEKEAKLFFQKAVFPAWREKQFKEFLKEKRKLEHAKGSHAKPYTDYLEAEERRQFKDFWKENKWAVFTALLNSSPPKSFFPTLFFQELLDKNFAKDKIATLQKTLEKIPEEYQMAYLESMRGFSELTSLLLGKYPHVRNTSGRQTQKHLAESFYPSNGYGYVRSSAFRQSAPQGSIFKLIVAYEALKERYEALKGARITPYALNPLTLTDDVQAANINKDSQVLGHTQEGSVITRMYKGGKLPRSSHANIGKINLQEALEQSSNIYFSLLASEEIKSPSFLLDATRQFGFGTKTAIDLPGEFGGKIPEDVTYDKTGLYAFAIGQHSLVVTPLQTAVMLCAFANGGEVLKPQIIRMIAAKENSEQSSPFDYNSDFAFEEHLGLIGLHFPLFTETLPTAKEDVLHVHASESKTSIFLPDEIRNFLMDGMHKVVAGPRGLARPSVVRNLCKNQRVFQDYLNLQDQLVGKTGTAELLSKGGIDQETKAFIKNYVWFAGICFENGVGEEEKWDNPELVIIVYLRDGSYGGKESAPYAAQMAKKWKEIKKKNPS